VAPFAFTLKLVTGNDFAGGGAETTAKVGHVGKSCRSDSAVNTWWLVFSDCLVSASSVKPEFIKIAYSSLVM